MNKKFVFNLISTPALFASMLSMVMMTRPAHANQTITPAVGTHLSCVRAPHGEPRRVCIQVSNDTPAPNQQQVQKLAQVQPNQIAELEFTDEQSDEAIKLFGCDCPVCVNAVRQLHGLAPLPV